MTFGVNDRFDFTASAPDPAELGAVHLIAIGGTGMSGVARLLLARGVPVSGSDVRDSETLQALARDGAQVHVGHDDAHLGNADTVVVSSAIREENVELAAARRRGLRVLHRAQALAALMHDRQPVAVAGANGKTTTSAMLTVSLQHCGASPSFAIGADLRGQGVNAAPGQGEIFVVEADESDGSFLVYRPTVAVVTNVKPDHLDFYGDDATLRAAYRAFGRTLRPGGLLVAGADDPGAAELAAGLRAQGYRVLTYGSSEHADLRLSDIGSAGLRWWATVHGLPGGTRRLEVNVPGEHNLYNAGAAALAATAGLGQDVDAVLAGLAAFGGTRRRFEPVGQYGGTEVVDDYAHNPDKVAAAVRTGRVLAGAGRLIVVFQPHLYSRTRDFAADFATALAPADVLLVLDVYAARENPVPGVSGQLITDGLGAQSVDGPAPVHRPEVVRFVPETFQVPAMVADLAGPGDLVLTVGAGDVTDLGPQILSALQRRGGVAARRSEV